MAKKFKFNIIKTLITISCFVILGTVGRNVFTRHFFNNRLTVIPNVVNLNEKDAVKYLKEAGLNVKIISSKTEKVPLDTDASGPADSRKPCRSFRHHQPTGPKYDY